MPFALAAKSRKLFVEKAVTTLKKRKWIKRGTRLAVVTGSEEGEGFDVVEIK
jgi:hypothetical protein